MSAASDIIEDYESLFSAEERLEWLMHRGPVQPLLSNSEISEDNRVRECQSKLWFRGELRDGKCFFRVRGDSLVVQGVAAFLCDLSSDISPGQVVQSVPELIAKLKLEAFLGMTRRIVVARVSSLTHAYAKGCLAGAAEVS